MARPRVERGGATWTLEQLAAVRTIRLTYPRWGKDELVILLRRAGIRAISIDNRSEFMAEFEAACAHRGIRLFVLPPRRPKLHGAVERANRTHTEKFYEVTDAEPDLEAFQAGLRAWETVYNTIRPHQALGYLTPAEYLASVGVHG